MSQATALSDNVGSIVWATLEKVSQKEGVRDELVAGAQHEVDLQLSGDVDGLGFEQFVSAVVNIGHDQMRATSATPDQAHLLAVVLAKLNVTTREKLLRELPDQFAAAGERLPDVDPALVETAAAMLKRLRSKKSVRARGAVRCQYRLKDHCEPPSPSANDGAVFPLRDGHAIRAAG